MQYFPLGGAGIGPTAPGTTAIGAAYAPGGVTGTYIGAADRAGGGAGGGAPPGGVAAAPPAGAGPAGSTCGSV